MGFGAYKINYEKLAKLLEISNKELRDAVEECKVGGIARVWKYEDNGKSGKAQISVSKKYVEGSYTVGKVTNGYETTFIGNVSVAGDAYKKLQNAEIPNNGLPIRICSCDVTTRTVDNKWYTNYTIFALDILAKGADGAKNNNNRKSAPDVDDGPKGDLPF